LSHPFLWQKGVITDSGSLDGTTNSARGINNRGQVIGLTLTASNELRAFFWQDGVMTVLGTLGGPFSIAWDINVHGQIVGQSATASGETHEVLWTSDDFDDD